MSLHLTGTITADDVHTIKKLDKQRPVYLLVGAPGQKIVVKRDTTAYANDPSNMRYGLRNMKAVDRTMATKQLTSAEIEALRGFAQYRLDEAGLFRIQAAASLRAEMNQLTADLDEKMTGVSWVKTNFFEGLVNLETAAASAAAGDKSAVRAVAAALNAAGGLERLGEILAVDLFNGNNDRFEFAAQPQVEPGFIRLANPGNVALCLQDNVLKPVGMDAYAGSAETRGLGTTTHEMANWFAGWPGVYLKPEQKPWRLAFAEDVVEDIEYILGPRNRRFSFTSKNRLPKNAATRLVAGIESGAQKLKVKLLNMYRPEKRPPGLIQRMVALGWAERTAAGGIRPAAPKGAPPPVPPRRR